MMQTYHPWCTQDPTTVKWAFNIAHPGSAGKHLSNEYTIAVLDVSDIECDAAPGTTYAEGLIHQLDTNLLASGLLFSPFCTLSRLPGVANVPILRTISSLGCVLVATSFVTSAIFRLRMKLLKDPGHVECFAQKLHRAQTGPLSPKYVIASSPSIMIFGSIMLFLVLLSGWVLGQGTMHNIPVSAGAGFAENILLVWAIAAAVIYCGLVLKTAFTLGRRPQI